MSSNENPACGFFSYSLPPISIMFCKFENLLQHNRQFFCLVAVPAEMPFRMLDDDLGTKFVPEVVLIIKRNPRVVVGKNSNAFREMGSDFIQAYGSTQPVFFGLFHIGLVLEPS